VSRYLAPRRITTPKSKNIATQRKFEQNKQMNSYFHRILRLLAFLLLCGVFIGCASHRATQRTTRSDAVLVVRDTLRDSVRVYNDVVVRDSVIVRLQGDTVLRDRWHTETAYRDRWRDRWHTVQVHDTCIVVDSVRVEVPVERRLTKFQRLRQSVGSVALLALLAFAGIVAARIIRRLKI